MLHCAGAWTVFWVDETYQTQIIIQAEYCYVFQHVWSLSFSGDQQRFLEVSQIKMYLWQKNFQVTDVIHDIIRLLI